MPVPQLSPKSSRAVAVSPERTRQRVDPAFGRGHLTMAAVATIALAAALLAISPVAAQAAPSPSVVAIERRMAELANQSCAVGHGRWR